MGDAVGRRWILWFAACYKLVQSCFIQVTQDFDDNQTAGLLNYDFTHFVPRGVAGAYRQTDRRLY